jgi:hypothetical protein
LIGILLLITDSGDLIEALEYCFENSNFNAWVPISTVYRFGLHLGELKLAGLAPGRRASTWIRSLPVLIGKGREVAVSSFAGFL